MPRNQAQGDDGGGDRDVSDSDQEQLVIQLSIAGKRVLGTLKHRQ